MADPVNSSDEAVEAALRSIDWHKVVGTNPFTQIAVIEAARTVAAAVRAEAVADEQRGITAPFANLASQWEDLLATQSEIMTTAQRNAWRDALAELRHVLAAGSVPVATPEPCEWCGEIGCVRQRGVGRCRVTAPPDSATPPAEPRNLYDIARDVTDEVLGRGTYDELHKDNPDPKIQEAIIRGGKDEDLRTTD